MNKKQIQEQTSAIRQIELLSAALQSAEKNNDYWLNVGQGKQPRIYTTGTKGATCSPFNSLILSLHAAENGYKAPLYISFADAKKRGDGVLSGQRGVPINWYSWESYANRNNPDEIIDRKEYFAMNEEDRKQYKGIQKRQTLTLFNLEQTVFPKHQKQTFSELVKENGAASEPVEQQKVPKEIRDAVKSLEKAINDNLVKVRNYPDSREHFNVEMDEISLPNIKQYHNYTDYVQDLIRQAVTATGQEKRLAREGASPTASPAMAKYEALVVEVASAIKMQELGLPGRLDPKTHDMVEYWVQELNENPRMLRALEADVNIALKVIKKAEQGEKIEYAASRNEDDTLRAKPTERPSESSSRDFAILTDIVAHGGMMIADGNFSSEEEKTAFLKKFGLDYYAKKLNTALEMAQMDDPDLIEEGYTEAQITALDINRICLSSLAGGWSDTDKFSIAQQISKIPNSEGGKMVVVWDKDNAIADVILPKCAMSGGMVKYQNGDKRPYYITPDEVMSEEDRTAKRVEVIPNELKSFSKEKIVSSIVAESQDGKTYVRFFNREGCLGYLPDDSYFEGKTVAVAKLSGNGLKVLEELDITAAVAEAVGVKPMQFATVQMIRDDADRWQLYLQPKDESGYCVYPSKEDINRFFVAIKQGNTKKSEDIKQELGDKYHALAEKDPTIKTELFAGVTNEDVTRISRVTVFRTNDDKFKITATIDGEKQRVRELTRLQWQRLWINKDVQSQKERLAAQVYKDVLHPQQKVEEKQQQEVREEEGVSNSQRSAVAEQFAKLERQPIFTMPNEEVLHIQYNLETDNLEVGGVTNIGLHVAHTFPYDHDFSLDENLQGAYEKLSEMEEYQTEEIEEDAAIDEDEEEKSAAGVDMDADGQVEYSESHEESRSRGMHR